MEAYASLFPIDTERKLDSIKNIAVISDPIAKKNLKVTRTISFATPYSPLLMYSEQIMEMDFGIPAVAMI